MLDEYNPAHACRRKNIEHVEAALLAKGYSLTDEAYAYPVGYDLPPTKLARYASGEAVNRVSTTAEAAAAMASNPDLAYPDTDQQYQEQWAAYYEQQLSHAVGTQAASAAASTAASAGVVGQSAASSSIIEGGTATISGGRWDTDGGGYGSQWVAYYQQQQQYQQYWQQYQEQSSSASGAWPTAPSTNEWPKATQSRVSKQPVTAATATRVIGVRGPPGKRA